MIEATRVKETEHILWLRNQKKMTTNYNLPQLYIVDDRPTCVAIEDKRMSLLTVKLKACLYPFENNQPMAYIETKSYILIVFLKMLFFL